MRQPKNKGTRHALTALALVSISTVFCFIPIFLIGLAKLFPNQRWQARCTRRVDAIAEFWTQCNNHYLKRMPTEWDVNEPNSLQPKDWYLVVANHQSWLDIIVLHYLFNRKIPVLKFFIKDQLKWVPLLGFAWWTMGCPFIKRYSKAYLAKKPHKQGKDLKATFKAINTFKQTPASVMNFVEGTRFTSNKHQHQNSPYQHLLKPKAGGISFVISSMGQQINSLLDVSIVYSSKSPSLWAFLCHRIEKIKIHVRQLPIPQQFTQADFIHDQQIQNEFRAWLNLQWIEKDRLITALKS